jgi:oligopeptide/dipeptide ABC transporter ATP-binding protein
MEPLLEADNIVQEFSAGWGRPAIRAVSRVSFQLRPGETLGIVGETGSGKSTLARALLQIPRPTSGSVRFRGNDLTKLRGRRLLEHRRDMQLVFQDPFGSLNPKWRVLEIVEEPLIGYKAGDAAARKSRVVELLELVGLPAGLYGRRFPRELSGGQYQRVAIARALALNPALIICDEAVSSLDALVQAHVLSLLRRLRAELGLSYLFISHDLAVVRHISHRAAVLHRGRLCEIGPVDSLFGAPRHPYTAALIAAAPELEQNAGRRAAASRAGSPPALDAPTGCRFRLSCPLAQERCVLEEPELRQVGHDHLVACHFALEQRRGSDRAVVRARESG